MKTPVMFLLSALLVTMVTMVTSDGHEDEPAANYNPTEMAGKWYIVAIATNHWTVTTTPTTPVNVTTVSWPRVEASASTLTLTFKEAPSCSSQTLTLDVETNPGLFEYTSGDYEYEMVVLEVNYAQGYAFVHTAPHPTDTDNDCINMLYSRKTTVSDAILNKFKRHSKEDDGIPDGNVKTLTGTGC